MREGSATLANCRAVVGQGHDFWTETGFFESERGSRHFGHLLQSEHVEIEALSVVQLATGDVRRPRPQIQIISRGFGGFTAWQPVLYVRSERWGF